MKGDKNMNVDAKKFLNKIDYLEKKLIGEDKKIFVEALFLFNECARMLEEKELQVKKQKEVIDKVIEMIEPLTEFNMCTINGKILKKPLEILKEVSE
jgi:hypothetical protein